MIKANTACENDTLDLEDVLDPANTGRDLYGDKGYVDGGREQRLKAQGWRAHIQRQAQISSYFISLWIHIDFGKSIAVKKPQLSE